MAPVRNHSLVFLFSTLLALVLAPSIVAPPEESFVSGQPDMQEFIDKMQHEEKMIKKSLQFPVGGVAGYPELLTVKTSHLLEEAEHMLNRVKNFKERRWVEAFVHRLKILNTMVKKSMSVEANENAENHSSMEEHLQTPPTSARNNQTIPVESQGFAVMSKSTERSSLPTFAAMPEPLEITRGTTHSDMPESSGSEPTFVVMPKLIESIQRNAPVVMAQYPNSSRLEKSPAMLVPVEESNYRHTSTDIPKSPMISSLQESPAISKSSENIQQPTFATTPRSSKTNSLQKYSTIPSSLEQNRLQTSPATPIPERTVPELDQQQAVKLTSNYPVTLPEQAQVLPISDNPGYRQVVTRPGLVPEKKPFYEDDELVRELEELPKLVALERYQGNSTPAAISPAKVSASPSPADVSALPPLKRKNLRAAYQPTDIHELQHLGETGEEITKALHLDELRLSGIHNNRMFYSHPKELEFHKMENGNDDAIQRVQEVNSDETMISRMDPNVWRSSAAPYIPKQPYTNDSFQEMHINLQPMNQQILAGQIPNDYQRNPIHTPMRTLPRDIQSILQKLQSQNYLLKTRLMAYSQIARNGNSMIVPGPNEPGQFLPTGNRYFADPSLGRSSLNTGSRRPNYTPYPYSQNPNHKNDTWQGNLPGLSPFTSKSFLNHNKNSEFSDEMKRQLRDGKVILLSDSVVRSNFEPEPDSEGGENKRVSSKPGGMSRKNGTRAQN